MKNEFINYLERVVDVLELHAQKSEVMAGLFDDCHQLQGNELYRQSADMMNRHATQLREHASHISEVITQPHLLIMQ